ncbi:inovirus-type Gp2 protein [Billgrantia sulfidoxydans]|uniref:Inovirus-type Gp2 protein n=1 Tax=Billgrantia sulfidoxydans TaxID=2733484 RepID=A0ABX7W641_9GAMM|nr:inovirus-type Gp2 protein [Halomonas sulfidoxydans]QTP55851.1 inovirus-type Gp2 protein [Halomonas sulfidoxydans]
MCYDETEVQWPGCEFDLDHVRDEAESNLDEEVLTYFKEVRAVVERLFRTDEELFDVFEKEGRAPCIRSWSLTGKMLKRLIENSRHNQFSCVQLMNSHPYVRVYHDAAEDFRIDNLYNYDPYEQVDRLNAAVAMIRKECRGAGMRQYMRRLERAKQARMKGAQKLVNGLRAKYARLEVLRLDLSYRKGKYVDLDDFRTALGDVKEDWERFRQDLLRGVPIRGVVGYMAKLEYGLLSGFHFHVIALCDGSKHREDITLAKMLGDHWRNQIVSEGEGRYYNCNRHKSHYRYLGIGTLDYYDDAKYSAFVGLVVDYMVKTDYVMAAEAPGERTWFRSACKNAKPERRRGRPRKLQSLESRVS